MGREEAAALLTRVAGLRRRIDAWRETRRNGAPMPEELWAMSVGLAEEVGVYPISRALRVDYGTLKKRVEGERRDGLDDMGPDGFVEVNPLALLGPPASQGTVLELSGADGAKLVMRLAGCEAVDVAGLADRFWRRGG